jgi:hypothetical protein
MMARRPVPTTPENYLSKFIDGMLAQMFQAEHRRLQGSIDRLVDQQEEIANSGGLLAFMFKGTVYRSSLARFKSANNRYPSLHLSLWGAMDEHLADATFIERDRQTIQQVLFKCLQGHGDMQDFRNRLPEILLGFLKPEHQQMPRTVPFEEATCLNDRDMKMYLKILPRIEMYAVSRMIY